VSLVSSARSLAGTSYGAVSTGQLGSLEWVEHGHAGGTEVRGVPAHDRESVNARRRRHQSVHHRQRSTRIQATPLDRDRLCDGKHTIAEIGTQQSQPGIVGGGATRISRAKSVDALLDLTHDQHAQEQLRASHGLEPGDDRRVGPRLAHLRDDVRVDEEAQRATRRARRRSRASRTRPRSGADRRNCLKSLAESDRDVSNSAAETTTTT